jgi:hypothetical protein
MTAFETRRTGHSTRPGGQLRHPGVLATMMPCPHCLVRWESRSHLETGSAFQLDTVTSTPTRHGGKLWRIPLHGEPLTSAATGGGRSGDKKRREQQRHKEKEGHEGERMQTGVITLYSSTYHRHAGYLNYVMRRISSGLHRLFQLSKTHVIVYQAVTRERETSRSLHSCRKTHPTAPQGQHSPRLTVYISLLKACCIGHWDRLW